MIRLAFQILTTAGCFALWSFFGLAMGFNGTPAFLWGFVGGLFVPCLFAELGGTYDDLRSLR